MICEKCKFVSECDYYDKNIKPVLNTEQKLFTKDNYLRMLHKVLNDYECPDYESDVSDSESEV